MTTSQTLRAVAFGLGGLAALAAAVELTRMGTADDAGQAVSGDPHRATLARCRDLAPEDVAADEECRAAWEETRRRFFGLGPAGTE